MRRASEFTAQELANTAWAFAKAGQAHEELSAALARVGVQRIGEFDAPQLANTAWAFATAGHSDDILFAASVRAAERRSADFNEQSLANMAWAFATVGEPAPALLMPNKVLYAIESEYAHPPVMCYQMVIECLARTGQVVAGFALLARVEASGLLSNSDEDCYSMIRTLLEACRGVGDPDCASRLQVVAERLGLISLVAPAAIALVQNISPSLSLYIYCYL